MRSLLGVIPSGRPANQRMATLENRAGPRPSLGQSLPRRTQAVRATILPSKQHIAIASHRPRGGGGAPAAWRLSRASHITSWCNVPLLQDATLSLPPRCISSPGLWGASRLLFLLLVALVWSLLRTVAHVSCATRMQALLATFDVFLGTLRLDQGKSSGFRRQGCR
jgi:hypothetical protein